MSRTSRPYFFEVFAVVNFLIIQMLLWNLTPGPMATLPLVVAGIFPVAIQLASGVLIRGLIARRRRDPTYAQALRSPEWISDTLRLLLFGSLIVHTYCWIKLSVPHLHPRLHDANLWRFDQLLFFGYSPTVLFLNLFSNPPSVLRFIDWTYANIFPASAFIGFGYFLSDTRARLRIAFANGNALLWLTGAWLYVILPALGPAFRFPEVWLPVAGLLPTTDSLQALLFHNYDRVLHTHFWVSEPIDLILGVAAFPSLHVGFQMYVALWMRKLWRFGAIVFGVFLLLIVIGSVVTGWHYLTDGLAGAALACLSYYSSTRLTRGE